MSSYHSSFKYLNKNSNDDFHLLITHFDADSGEMDSYLSQDQVYTDYYNGSKRILYGTKWNSVATIKITVIKQNRSDFSVKECERIYKWLTGNPSATWLELYAGGVHQYDFLCTCQDVKPQKLDARTIGLNIYFESLSPWAYSPKQFSSCSFGQSLSINNKNILFKDGQDLHITNDGVLTNGVNASFDITNDGVVYVDNSVGLTINNLSDDLYSYVFLDTTFKNVNSDHLIIKNQTLYEKSREEDGETKITGMSENEEITLSSGQFIISSTPDKIFGNSFNFIWPKLLPGINEFVVNGTGEGVVEFTYRYPMKIGDCVIDIYIPNDECGCQDNTEYGTISWKDIAETPNTLEGYGITDTYTEKEIDNIINNIEITGGTGNMRIDEDELNDMLDDVLG